jgi:poly-gamma-glutamate synthesis protein (capsule biosynthesis protein)
MPRILIGADLCPIEGNRPFFIQGDSVSLFHDLLADFQRADLVVANLECPLIERPTPIAKTGPTFGEPSACINGIRQAGFGALCLANNHILDHGPEGLRNTIEVCSRSGIETFGAGENLEGARRLLVRNLGAFRVGFLGMAEREFSIARHDAPGANPIDLIEFVRMIQKRRAELDYLIVLFHGSDEFLVPTPRVQRTCRFMIEMGANVVIVQHPHEIGGWEAYRGGHIVYGQGALVMDEAVYRSRPSFHEGVLVELTIEAERSPEIRFIPFLQSSPVPGARKLTPERESVFLEEFDRQAAQVRDENFVEERWVKHCDKYKHRYLSSLLAHNRVLAKLNRGGAIQKLLHGRRALLGTRNIVSCETHQEAIHTIFNQQLI